VSAGGKKLAAAKRLRRTGRLREALAQGRDIIDADPENAETLHFLGLLSLEVNNFETAANLIGKAIAVNSRRAAYHRDLGTTLIKLDRLGDAAYSFLGAERYPWFPSMTVHFGMTEAELTAAFSEIVAAVAAIPPSA
jgi:Flp pilus assembly protein TadD|tara:strand:- start:745 stop:1155 length:411 start_codon:yes stop_codon:yes gene_type:complete